MQRTRVSLGTYRHDLLVALRMVNRIERTVKVEWEAFVRDEMGKCEALDAVVREKKNGTGTDDEGRDNKLQKC